MVATTFRHGDASNVDSLACEQAYESLSRLNSNVYKQRYPRAKDTVNASGLSKEELKTLLSTEGLKIVQEHEQPFLDRLQHVGRTGH